MLQSLSKALRLLRMFHDMSQQETAAALGISSPYLSQLESGKKTPTVDLIMKYSEVFKVSSSSIILLAERLQTQDFSQSDIESLVSPKVLRILGWLEEEKRPSEEREGDMAKKGVRREDQAKRSPKQNRRAS